MVCSGRGYCISTDNMVGLGDVEDIPRQAQIIFFCTLDHITGKEYKSGKLLFSASKETRPA